MQNVNINGIFFFQRKVKIIELMIIMLGRWASIFDVWLTLVVNNGLFLRHHHHGIFPFILPGVWFPWVRLSHKYHCSPFLSCQWLAVVEGHGDTLIKKNCPNSPCSSYQQFTFMPTRVSFDSYSQSNLHFPQNLRPYMRYTVSWFAVKPIKMKQDP